MTEFWMGFTTIVGAVALSWGLFWLGRLWERDHPKYLLWEVEKDSEIIFEPEGDWSVPMRRGIYDWKSES